MGTINMKALCYTCKAAMGREPDGSKIYPTFAPCHSCGYECGILYLFGATILPTLRMPGTRGAHKGKGTRKYAAKGNICHYCGLDMTDCMHLRTIDHKVPKCKGGTNAPHNKLIACRPCNLEKGSLDYDVYIKLREEKYGTKTDSKFHVYEATAGVTSNMG